MISLIKGFVDLIKGCIDSIQLLITLLVVMLVSIISYAFPIVVAVLVVLWILDKN